MSNDKFVYVTYIKSTPEKVWEALTDSENLEKFWFGSKFESSWEVGSKLIETRPNGKMGFHGEILKTDPPNLLSYSFITGDEDPTVVTFLITAEKDLVRLSITHVGYKEGSNIFNAISEGWTGILSGLKTFLETDESLNSESMEKMFAKSQNANS